MDQFDIVWAQLLLYVRDGKPSGLSTLNLSRDYKGTKLSRGGRITKHSFLGEVASQRFNALSAIQDQTATVEWAKDAFHKLDAISEVKKTSGCCQLVIHSARTLLSSERRFEAI